MNTFKQLQLAIDSGDLSVDEAMDKVYEFCDALMKLEAFHLLGSEMKKAPIMGLSIDMLIGILTATLPAKSKILHRYEFFHIVQLVLTERGQLEEGLLTGLE